MLSGTGGGPASLFIINDVEKRIAI